MDPHRWEAIQGAFDELVLLDEASRASRLARLGDSDPALRAAVESLLAADAEVSARLAPLKTGPDLLDLTGRDIFQFRVLEPLGAGGMGVVYRGQDTRLGRPVALKFLLPHYSLDASAKTRFLREARAAAALDHPHLCTIYDVRESEDGRLFLAMALYEGRTLKARLSTEGPLPVAEALAITSQIARGLGCVHAAGIVHRDLKPGNVMLLPNGTVKILDFGLAKALDDSSTATDTRFGTVAYMAPGQIRGEPVDRRADLWALGVVLYEMLTGQKPFRGEHEVAIAHAIVNEEPVAPGILRDGLPAAVEEVVLGLLQKDLGTRYGSADELLADLAAIGPLDESTVRALPTRRRRTGLRRLTTRAWLVTLGAVLVIAGVGYALWFRSGQLRPVSWLGIPLPDGEELAPAGISRITISPGGDRLVYMGPRPEAGAAPTGYEGVRLWVRTRDQLHATPLAGTERAVIPFFSPDGSRLGFITPRQRFTPTALKVVSPGAGPPHMVTDSLVDFGGAAWGYDGYIYFDGQLPGNGIARVRETGGLPEPVTITDTTSGELWHQQPEPLPNGKGVLFMIARGQLSQYEIGVVDLASRKHRALIRGVAPRYTASGHLVYTTVDGTLMAAPFDQDKLTLAGAAVPLAERVQVRDGQADLAISATGTLVYVAEASTRGRMELVWVARDGQAMPIDTTWHADMSSLALSPDGTELAIAVTEGGHKDIWIKRLDQGRAAKLTFQGDDNARPAWTPDRQAVTFVSNSRSGSVVRPDLYLARADGSAPPRLLREGAVQEAEYSRDGKWLVYRTGWDLFAVRTVGDTTPVPLVATSFLEATPTLSPDGRWLAYSSDESGRREVYVRPFPKTGSAKWQVSTAGGMEPLWSRNGRELFYKASGQTLDAATVLPGATFAVGKHQVLFSTRGYEHYWMQRTYDVSPDGSRFVMIRSPKEPPGELIMVENFFEVLKARVKRAAVSHQSR